MRPPALLCRRRRALSLPEVVVTLALVSVLAAVSYATYQSLQASAAEEALEATARSVGREIAALAAAHPDRAVSALAETATADLDVDVAVDAGEDEVVFTDGDVAVSAVYDRDGLVTLASDSDAPYRDVVLDADPVAYWPLDEPSGQPPRDVVNDVAASLSGSAALGMDNGPVDDQTSLSLPSDSARMLADDPNIAVPFTVDHWLWVDPSMVGDVGTAASQDGSSDWYTAFYDDHLRAFGYGDAAQFVRARFTPADISEYMGRWVHLVAVYDEAETRVYVDGQLAASEGDFHTGSTSGQLMFGRRASGSAGDRDLVGRLAHVAVFDDAQTAGQISARFDAAH